MPFNVGDTVKIKPPFDVPYSGSYIILANPRGNTFTVDVFNDGIGADFDDIYLEAV